VVHFFYSHWGFYRSL